VIDLPVRWYRDAMTGRTMDRPGWKRLEADVHTGEIACDFDAAEIFAL
jgi:hypothetical protein